MVLTDSRVEEKFNRQEEELRKPPHPLPDTCVSAFCRPARIGVQPGEAFCSLLASCLAYKAETIQANAKGTWKFTDLVSGDLNSRSVVTLLDEGTSPVTCLGPGAGLDKEGVSWE